MHPAKMEFGKLLLSRKAPTRPGRVWVAAGVVLLAAAYLIIHERPMGRSWKEVLSANGREPWVIGGLGVASGCLGIRRSRQRGSAEHFYDDGVCEERGRRRQWLAYDDVESVTYVVRKVGGALDRTLDFAGPGGQPQFHLWAVGADGDASVDGTPSPAEVQNVSSRVIKAVAERMIEWVDKGAAVKWTNGLRLTPGGLLLGAEAAGNIVPWAQIDGIKDGGQSGMIEVYAFGRQQPVATAPTRNANALAGYQAFMKLLERAQRPKVA